MFLGTPTRVYRESIHHRLKSSNGAVLRVTREGDALVAAEEGVSEILCVSGLRFTITG